MERSETAEQAILAAARTVFLQKGLTGARMQDIADRAGINKASLHYYYRNKETLFELVLVQSTKLLFASGSVILGERLEFSAKIQKFIANYLEVILVEPRLPLFVLYEFNANPEKYSKMLLGPELMPDSQPFLQQIKDEIASGRIRPIDPAQLIINIISLCMYPFIARPAMQTILHFTPEQFQLMLSRRTTEIFGFVMSALRP